MLCIYTIGKRKKDKKKLGAYSTKPIIKTIKIKNESIYFFGFLRYKAVRMDDAD
jgi:hypothetical protein